MYRHRHARPARYRTGHRLLSFLQDVLCICLVDYLGTDIAVQRRIILLDQLLNGCFISFSKRLDQGLLIQKIPSFSVDEEMLFCCNDMTFCMNQHTNTSENGKDKPENPYKIFYPDTIAQNWIMEQWIGSKKQIHVAKIDIIQNSDA